jgi:NTP pyrophosphatase (non-canonical NTP hydrolase)
MVEEARNLINVIQGQGSNIQEAFRTYQNKHFIERTPEFFCLELCGEAGELANLEKKLWKGKEISLEDVESEVADVYIALHNYANARGISLEKVVAEKLAKIEKKRSKHEADGTIY